MGPTASGKTEVALGLASEFPVDLISVDSAQVYRGMDIGTAKPDPETLARVPHRLIDVCDPEDAYSAGEFVRDAQLAMTEIIAAGRVPLLVGGTMMYFRSLTQGIADLPDADPAIRKELDVEAARIGWPALHARLGQFDVEAAARISPNDSQRIQRAIEIYRVSGRSLTDWHRQQERNLPPVRFLKLALLTPDRRDLHKRIARRLDAMMGAGFLDEVRRLRDRPSLNADASSMRAVGYRQMWAHLAGQTGFDAAMEKTLAATRQLAKRQHTWLRSESELNTFDPLAGSALEDIRGFIRQRLKA